MFFIGDRFYGTMTAHVGGADAANYRFTSGLPVQLLKALAPTLGPLLDPPAPAVSDSAPSYTTEARVVQTIGD